MAAVVAKKRGAFILFEGVDRCGKTTQCTRLLEWLRSSMGEEKVEFMRFPDRTTSIGTTINSYLTNAQEMDDRAIHLLFAANRWEAAANIRQKLAAGVTIVCDRYSYSGVAFTSAKPGMDLDVSSFLVPSCFFFVFIPPPNRFAFPFSRLFLSTNALLFFKRHKQSPLFFSFSPDPIVHYFCVLFFSFFFLIHIKTLTSVVQNARSWSSFSRRRSFLRHDH